MAAYRNHSGNQSPGDGAAAQPVRFARRAAADFAQRLRRVVQGELLFDAASRGRYSTDASIYQVEPLGVLVPLTEDDVRAALAVCRELHVPVLPRGAGSSQCGQAVGRALVIDYTKHLDEIIAFDADHRTIVVQPGLVLDRLNDWLKRYGLWFPVDVSTSAQATLGGMAGNNSCGSRSIAYGNMVHNVLGIEAVLADGTDVSFGPLDGTWRKAAPRVQALIDGLLAIGTREREEIERVWPKVMRRVGGYNLDIFHPQSERPYTPDRSLNLAHLLVGSEGTLASFLRLHLQLAPLPAQRVLGVVNFARFYRAMDCAQHIVKLAPTAVELVDRTMIDLARANPLFRPVIERALIAPQAPTPEALLLVEFAGDERNALLAKLAQLETLMGDLGLPGCVVQATEAAAQKALWEVRKAGLNIMMSMRGDGKPVSFIEDCAVPLEHLADYTAQLTEVFARHGTRGTWYAHASCGCLHVRPILDLRAGGAAKMRAIANEASALVRRFKGAYSGEHGDGLVRSEWVEWQFGPRLTRAFEEIKTLFDPDGLMNPGKIVQPSKMDDASLFRFKPDYAVQPLTPVLDWSAWDVQNDAVTERTTPPGTGGDPARGFGKAVEMCNNNGHCRKFDAGTMCPSFRVTRDEQHLTRGRANTLRLALSGQLGTEGIASETLRETLDLCVSCKGCKRECPTGVDVARMKIEFLHHYRRRHGLSLRERFIAHLPRYAPVFTRAPWLPHLRDKVPGAAWWAQRWLGLAAQRSLPRWRRDSFLLSMKEMPGLAPEQSDVVLLVDTFNNYFEPDNARAALKVLQAAGYRVHLARGADEFGLPARPLCCGRTYLSAGLVEAAQYEARRLLIAVTPYVERGVPVVGLEPSCLLGLRDEYLVMGLGEPARGLAERSLLISEFLVQEHAAGRLQLPLHALPQRQALVHGHCHEKAFDVLDATRRALQLVPGFTVDTITSSCCGMAGSFGYEANHYDISMRMAELSLLPAVRRASFDTLLVANGTSCRHQIADGTRGPDQRKAEHMVRVLERALAPDERAAHPAALALTPAQSPAPPGASAN